MRAKVLVNLASGDFDMAITAAFKQVEVTMRSRAGLLNSDFGSRLATNIQAGRGHEAAT